MTTSEDSLPQGNGAEVFEELPAQSVAGADAGKRKLGDDDAVQSHTSKPAKCANTGTTQIDSATEFIEYKL